MWEGIGIYGNKWVSESQITENEYKWYIDINGVIELIWSKEDGFYESILHEYREIGEFN